MRFKVWTVLALVLIVAMPPFTAVAGGPQNEKLEMYVLQGPADTVAEATVGIELLNVQYTLDATQAQAVLTRRQAAGLRAQGIDVDFVRNAQGQTVSEQAELQALNGYTVWRSWDEEGGIQDELEQLAADNPDLVRLEDIGTTHQGRDILAVRLTDGGRPNKPTVLYTSLQHAREWISGEVNRRTLHYFIDQYRAGDLATRDLLRRVELWFVIVANPDGYQFTFDNERLWRKNLRDNNNDGQITIGDGVDPNRNFADHWGYDNEGSSPDPADDTYRGPSAASEPETQAIQGLINRIKPKFMSNIHSFGEWLLYGQGWQTGTLDADNPVYVALGGTDEDPAIEGFNPGQSADTLYVTNGETTDYADSRGTVAFTPELGEGIPGSGFVFPDDEDLVQAEFERILPFHLALARSAPNPGNPISPVGITTEAFYFDQDEIDPQNGAHSLFDFTFDESYGDIQEVRVLAKRSNATVKLAYRVNGGDVIKVAAHEWNGGERYGPGTGTHYRVMTANVTGTAVGDQVEVWYEGGGARSDSFTYEVVSDTGNRLLVVAAEDYTGASPVQASGPNFLSFYTDALTAQGEPFDVYDVDANGRKAPDNLGVLSHYDAVIWYTGNDVVTREPGWGPGNVSRLAMQEIYELRDFMNEGGRVLYTGQRAGQQYTTSLGGQFYDPFENLQCTSSDEVFARCLPSFGSGNNQGDPIEYWLGAAILTPAGGLDPDTGDPFPISGVDDPLDGVALERNGPDSAQNQNIDSSFIALEDYLQVTDPAGSFPQFASEISAIYETGLAGPFEPHTGASFMWSQRADRAYKRLAHTINVPAGGATLSFWTSYNLELDFDYMIVEAHTVGQDNWTTLPDANGHTSDDLSSDQACTGGWSNPADEDNVLHPFLSHYQTFVEADGSCSNTGTTGSWNAANGSSGGWQQFEIDLSAFAGQQVEVSITVLSDWGLQQFPGVFVDDIEVSTGEGSTSFEDDGDPMDGWTIPGAPQDEDNIEGPNLNDWTRRGGLGIREGAAITTPDSVYLGFGFEGITDASTRLDVMDRIVEYLLR
ncbi:MAG TPA: M14 family zinc carboxypeptidase [Candidatus Limnocylindria bacterium]|nr:M14 family zinc carboxypeptidase [Candidatus Limnocylindria bacterium]